MICKINILLQYLHGCTDPVFAKIPSMWFIFNYKFYKQLKISISFPFISPAPYQQFMVYRWLSTRLQYLQCVSNGDSEVLHWAINMYILFLKIPAHGHCLLSNLFVNFSSQAKMVTTSQTVISAAVVGQDTLHIYITTRFCCLLLQCGTVESIPIDYV